MHPPVFFDAIPLGDALADAAAPKPFRLLKTGENILTKSGSPYRLTLSDADVRAPAHRAFSIGKVSFACFRCVLIRISIPIKQGE